MDFYSTELLIENVRIPYMVYPEGDRLFFKPSRTGGSKDAPVFWVQKSGDMWNPLNITDTKITDQVRAAILQHQAH
ncbi:MAG: hypothetical protein V4725_16395 [Bacteroidota bacterium]